MSRRKSIIKDAGIYALSAYCSQALDMVNAVLVRRFLGPTNMGIWSFLQVILSYGKHASLGITAATSRDVPYFLGKGEKQKAVETQNLVFSFTFASSFIAAGAVVLYAWAHRSQYQPVLFHGLLIVAALLVLQRLYNLFVALLRAYKEFTFAALLNVVSSATGILFTLALTWKFKLYGFFAGMLLNFMLSIALIHFKTAYRFAFLFSWKKILPIIQFGLVMLAFDIVRSVLVSVDRLVITKFLGFEALGYYSIAIMANTYVASFPTMLSVIFFPHFQEAFAKKDDVRDLEVFLVEPLSVMSCLMPVLIGGIWILSGPLVRAVLPQFVNGVPAMKWVLLGTFFYALIHSFEAFLITIKRHWLLMPVTALSLGLGFLLMRIAVSSGRGIEGVAVASIGLWMFHFTALAAMCLRRIFPWRKVVMTIGKVYAAFLYLILVLTLTGAVNNTGNGPGATIPSFILFLLAMGPLIYLAEKRHKVVSTLAGLLSRGRQSSQVISSQSVEELEDRDPADKDS